MNFLAITLSALSFLLLGCTLLCGAWLRAKGSTPEGAAFHARLAMPTTVMALITILVLLLQG